MKNGLPDSLVEELDNSAAFMEDPDGRRSQLLQIGLRARRQRLINEEQLSEFLDMVDAGREWALSEHEEAAALGITGYESFDEREGGTYWDGKRMVGTTGPTGGWCRVGRIPEEGKKKGVHRS